MENNKIIKIGAVCVVAYIGVNIACNVARCIVMKIEEKKEYERLLKRQEEFNERMKKYDETKDLQNLMDAVFYM